MLTKFEKARVLGARALQLSLGAPPIVKIPRNIDNQSSLEVARYEIDEGVVPIVVVREKIDGTRELVELN